MDGQINLFDYIDEQQGFSSCQTCEHCHQTDLCKCYTDKNGVFHFLGFCNQVRQCITENTGSWLCKNRHYKRH